MKRFIIALLSIVVATTASAQELRWGATGALNFSWAHSTVNSSDAYIGFNAGVKVEMDFSDYITDGFYLDGRLLYTLKGGRWAGYHQNLGYLELPVTLGYRYRINDDVALMGGLGPYFGLGIVGKDVQKNDGTKVKTDIFGEGYKRFDFGLNYQIGVEMMSNWQVFLGLEHSLMNIMKSKFTEASDVKVRPINFYIGTAYMF